MPPTTTPVRLTDLSVKERRKRADRLARMSDDEQMAALTRREYTLDEWCAFARQFPERVARVNGEFAFIAVTTPEVADR